MYREITLLKPETKTTEQLSLIADNKVAVVGVSFHTCFGGVIPLICRLVYPQ